MGRESVVRAGQPAGRLVHGDRQPHDPLHQLQRGTSDRIRNRRVNERTGDEVELDDIVKGYDIGGEYVLVEPAELDEIAPGRSRSLEIAGFVDLAEVDPIFFDKTHYLGPGGKGFGKVYSLREQALAKVRRVSPVASWRYGVRLARPGVTGPGRSATSQRNRFPFNLVGAALAPRREVRGPSSLRYPRRPGPAAARPSRGWVSPRGLAGTGRLDRPVGRDSTHSEPLATPTYGSADMGPGV
ncbi:Ku protein [Streptomyces sp. NPDC002138]|uniref:Ku protein n=1 Tax=Streptomyces sp. NPDC002138 TaxID=3154410 RepID=UPI00332D35BA